MFSAFTRSGCLVSEYEASEEMRAGVSKTVDSVCVYNQKLVGCCHGVVSFEESNRQQSRHSLYDCAWAYAGKKLPGVMLVGMYGSGLL